MQNDKFFWGLGMWLWEWDQCEGGNEEAIIAKAKDTGLSYVIAKVWDGSNRLYPQITSETVKNFHAANIKFYAWGFCYGGSTLSDELAQAIDAIDPTKLNADGVVLDCEDAFFNEGSWAKTLASGIRVNIVEQQGKGRRPLLALSSYGDPITQAKEPFQAFLDYCDVYMPQAYFNAWIGQKNETPQVALYDLGYSQWQIMAENLKSSMRTIIPTLPTYQEYGYNLTADELKAAMDYLKGYNGINFWSWQHTGSVNNDLWNMIAAYKDIPFVGADYPLAPTSYHVQVEMKNGDTWQMMYDGTDPDQYSNPIWNTLKTATQTGVIEARRIINGVIAEDVAYAPTANASALESQLEDLKAEVSGDNATLTEERNAEEALNEENLTAIDQLTADEKLLEENGISASGSNVMVSGDDIENTPKLTLSDVIPYEGDHPFPSGDDLPLPSEGSGSMPGWNLLQSSGDTYRYIPSGQSGQSGSITVNVTSADLAAANEAGTTTTPSKPFYALPPREQISTLFNTFILILQDIPLFQPKKS